MYVLMKNTGFYTLPNELVISKGKCMLCSIIQQLCRIVTICRCFITDCRMLTFKVVRMDICSYGCSGFFQTAVLCQIGLLIFEASEPSFNHDIICPAALSIHALTDMVLLQEVHLFMTGKLASLVRVQDDRFGYFKSFF